MAAIFLTVLIYFAVNLAAYFMDPYTTTVAYSSWGRTPSPSPDTWSGTRRSSPAAAMRSAAYLLLPVAEK